MEWPHALPRPANARLRRRETVGPWFEIREVNDRTLALLEPKHFEEVISYLILGDSAAILFDTGMGISDIRVEVERLTRLPVIVVNSHSHYDHIGGNHLFDEVWAYDESHEVSRIEEGYPRPACREFMQPGLYFDLPAGFDPATHCVRPSRVTRRLHHLEEINIGGRTLVVHHTPGETPGAVCLHDRACRLLFTGDTFYPATLWLHREESDFGRYVQSIEHLVGLLGDVTFLCPAHNEACVPAEMLRDVYEACGSVLSGRAKPEVQGGIRVYRFNGFNIRLGADT